MARSLSETYTDTAIPRVMGYAQRSQQKKKKKKKKRQSFCTVIESLHYDSR